MTAEGDWGFGDPDDPQAAAREQRRREREARRRARAQPSGQSPPESSGDPPPRSAGEPPPPQRPLPSSPAREPFAQRVTAMRKRLSAAGSRGAGRPPRKPRPRREGGVSLTDSMVANWRWIVAALAALLLLWFLIALFQPLHGDPGEPVVVTIPKGTSAGEVGDLLDDAGVVSSATMFEIRATIAGKRSDLLPGTYTLREDQSYGDALDALTTPAQQRTTATVTVPEGLSRAQVAPLVKQAGLTGGYARASVRSRFLDPASYGAQGRARSLEGFLFPDTYELKAEAPAADLVQLQLQNFKRQIRSVDMRYARSKNLNVYDVLTIASMIEREVQVPRERRLVAAVIYNRLADGMPLGIDATTRFAVGNYTRPLTESELADPSPYNTRLHSGLPPGPIGSPGLAAIEAAARPAKVDHLFYVVRPGTCGEHNFSSTEAQFLRDQAAYQRALEAEGGSPDSC